MVFKNFAECVECSNPLKRLYVQERCSTKRGHRMKSIDFYMCTGCESIFGLEFILKNKVITK